MKTKQYHPIRGAVMAMLLAGLYYIAVSAVVSLVVSDANSILSELIRIISLVPLLLLYKLWHRKELPHLFGIAGTARGMLLSGIYLKTGSFWPCVILHTWVDAASSISKSLQESSGVLTRTHTTLEIIILFAFTIAFYVNAFMVFKVKQSSRGSDEMGLQ